MKYKFTAQNTIIFIAGAPSSGKTILAPLVSFEIENCIVQHMDIIRMLSEHLTLQNGRLKENKLVSSSSVDAYTQIGDGSYSPKNLIEGYKLYSQIITKHFLPVIAKLNPEDVNNMILEGVQLMPELLKDILSQTNTYLFVLTANKEHYKKNAKCRFVTDELRTKYSPKKLKLIEVELVSQANALPTNNYTIIPNSKMVQNTVNKVLQCLLEKNIISRI